MGIASSKKISPERKKKKKKKGNDDDDDEDDDDDGDDDDDDDDDEESEMATTVSSEPTGAYADPPMPTMGNPVNFDLLVDRNKNVNSALETMFTYINRDIDKSIKAAVDIPVSRDTERVIVQQDTIEYMARAKTIKDSRTAVKKSLEQIHRALVYRKSSLEMMNANYAKKMVRKVDKVDLKETRSTLDIR